MSLRFVEDRRTLLWAFGLFPLLPLLAFAQPRLLPWLMPLLLYTSYCSGVLSHNHNHCPVFRSRRWNMAYGAWLSLFYGFPIFAWIPTHNQNHHRHTDGEQDATSTRRHSSKNTLLAALSYPLASSRWQFPAIARYARDAFGRHPARARRVTLEIAALVLGHAGLLALACGLHGLALGSLVYVLSVGAPAFLGSYWMMLTNFLQHVECEPGSVNAHSRNFTSRIGNWLIFDNGLHTVHHEYPGVHWSRYRRLHQLRAARIPAELNQSSLLRYLARQYFLSPSRERAVADVRGS